MWQLLALLIWLLLPSVLILLLLAAHFFLIRGCPACDGETLLLQSPLLQSPLLRPLRGIVGMRWCLQCGWEGLARPPHRTPPLRKDELGYRRADAPNAHPPRRGGSR